MHPERSRRRQETRQAFPVTPPAGSERSDSIVLIVAVVADRAVRIASSDLTRLPHRESETPTPGFDRDSRTPIPGFDRRG